MNSKESILGMIATEAREAAPRPSIELKVGAHVYHPVDGRHIITEIVPGVRVVTRPLYWHEKLMERWGPRVVRVLGWLRRR